MVEINAGAKVNLSLAVMGKRGDMHTLDTVIMPVPLYDTVRINKRNDGEVCVRYSGKESLYPFDTAKKIAEKIVRKYGTCGVDIDIVKRIPEGAGMGGSSADAAGVARGMELLFGYGNTSPEILSDAGSDVAAMYFGAPCRVRGIGERITPVYAAKKIRFAVVLCKNGVNTGDCYSRYDIVGGESGDTEKIISAIESGGYFMPFNDLYPAAVEIEPEIKVAKELLESSGFISGMTGSGSAVFGYEYDERAFFGKLERLKKASDGKFEILTF